jgi:membrane associated rhomboid family serine protease
VIFAMVAFSLTWDYLLLTLPPVSADEKFFGVLGAILIFIFLYPSSRLPFVAEEALTQQSRFSQAMGWVFFLLNLIVCVGNVPGLR